MRVPGNSILSTFAASKRAGRWCRFFVMIYCQFCIAPTLATRYTGVVSHPPARLLVHGAPAVFGTTVAWDFLFFNGKLVVVAQFLPNLDVTGGTATAATR